MYRDEIWVVLNGTAYVENGDSVCEYGRKDILFIKSNTLHRVTNCSGEMLVIQETQIGEHTIENDIVRVENRN